MKESKNVITAAEFRKIDGFSSNFRGVTGKMRNAKAARRGSGTAALRYEPTDAEKDDAKNRRKRRS